MKSVTFAVSPYVPNIQMDRSRLYLYYTKYIYIVIPVKTPQSQHAIISCVALPDVVVRNALLIKK